MLLRGDGGGYCAVNAQEVGDGFWWTAAEAAFGGDAEICDDALRCCDALPRSFDSVGVMDQSQVEFRFGMELQVAQGGKVGIVGAVARDGHMDPVDRPLDAG